MRWHFQKLTEISIAQLCNVLLRPSRVLTIMRAPDALGNQDFVQSLFPLLRKEEIESCRLEYLSSGDFFAELNQRMVQKRHRQIEHTPRYELLYMLVRFAKPKIIVETGVFDGQTSAVLLQALHANKKGTLVSVDLPATAAIKDSTDRIGKVEVETALPLGCQPGWLVPEYLRARYHLVLGDSKAVLPRVVRRYPEIDMFFHDSLHTFEHQHFEYTTVWPHIKDGGIFLSDDIFWSSAFARFCREQQRSYIHDGRIGAVRR